MEHYVEIFAVIILFVMFAAIIAIVIFASTKSRREYRRIKNISESEGTVTDIEFIESHPHDGISGEYYVISYSFTDICGKTHNKNFKNHRLGEFKEGDKLLVYYDMDNPDKCVTDYKLKADKNQWWQALIITAVMIIVPFVIAFAVSD